MKLTLHAYGKTDHLEELNRSAEAKIEFIEADASLSADEKRIRVAAVRAGLDGERRATWWKLF